MKPIRELSKELFFRDVIPVELPPKREVDHKIELISNIDPPTKAPYRMSSLKLEELFIRPFKAPFDTPILFWKKHDGSLRLCIDYRVWNKTTVKNRYPIPLIADLFDHISRVRWFSKLDLRSRYHQVRIVEGDKPKTMCVLQPFLDYFLVIYLGDIVMYNKLHEEHVDHLREVFQTLRENELYVKEEKCSFAQREVPFLGHMVEVANFRWMKVKFGLLLIGSHQPRQSRVEDSSQITTTFAHSGTPMVECIVCLLKYDGFVSIVVVVDKFSKYGTFIQATKKCLIEEAAHLDMG
ncbi:RNA-directed DNA polymerase-like protein [Gossypium australe]|uniref:RNA-directed DNA polymerase-like protein n=1 Tax=Gossypium australe TaxID=47621 RepID=A0A5B6WRA2_9ROSI|nr:RNA-directed DNA polymerase-like protein [Gossypium australe]